MPRQIFILLILPMIAGAAVFGQSRVSVEWVQDYVLAERYYNQENATARSDSLAFCYYGRTIGLLAGGHTADSILADSYLKCGVLRMTAGRIREAVKLFLDGTVIAGGNEKRTGRIAFLALLYAGSCYYELYHVDSALYFYRQAEDLLIQHPRFEGRERLYNKMGVLYYESGDYRRSIPYFRQALEVIRESNKPDPFLTVNYQNNIASALLKLEEYPEAIAIFTSLLPMQKYRQEITYNIGVAYLDWGHPEEALGWLHKAHYRSLAGSNAVARAWLKMGKPDSAAPYLDARRSGVPGTQNDGTRADEANRQKLLGDWWMLGGDAGRAARHYQRAIMSLDREFRDSSLAANPTEFWGIYQYYALFDMLVAKARALKQLAEEAKEVDSRWSFACYESALALARHVERTYLSDQARLFLAGKADVVYQEAVLSGWRLYRQSGERDSLLLRKIFGLTEASKATVLLTKLGDPGEPLLSGQARQLAAMEKEKKAEASRLQSLLASAADTVIAGRIGVQLRELEIEISGIQGRLDQFPEYRLRKFSDSLPNPVALQAELGNRKAGLLAYFIAGDSLFCFYATKMGWGCAVSHWGPEAGKKVLLMHRLLNDGGSDHQAIEEMIGDLSARLIYPMYRHVGNESRWVIVPCRELHYLPFETLLAPGDKGLLVYRHAISYAYSAALRHGPTGKKGDEYRVLALAPFVTGSGEWSALTASGAEVKGLPGLVLTGDSATELEFTSHLKGYPVIHLATHAKADGERPERSYIAFAPKGGSDSNGRLYEPAICHLDLEGAKLVILSACETADGPLVQSEGVISLSRAFSYGGAQSVVTSLWKADDPATAYIVGRLHYYLRRGYDKDLALQRAKLDYLGDESIDRRHRQPAYWAHLVLMGDVSHIVPMDTDARILPWVLFLIIPVIFALYLYKRTRRGDPRPVMARTPKGEV